MSFPLPPESSEAIAPRAFECSLRRPLVLALCLGVIALAVVGLRYGWLLAESHTRERSYARWTTGLLPTSLQRRPGAPLEVPPAFVDFLDGLLLDLDRTDPGAPGEDTSLPRIVPAAEFALRSQQSLEHQARPAGELSVNTAFAVWLSTDPRMSAAQLTSYRSTVDEESDRRFQRFAAHLTERLGAARADYTREFAAVLGLDAADPALRVHSIYLAEATQGEWDLLVYPARSGLWTAAEQRSAQAERYDPLARPWWRFAEQPQGRTRFAVARGKICGITDPYAAFEGIEVVRTVVCWAPARNRELLGNPHHDYVLGIDLGWAPPPDGSLADAAWSAIAVEPRATLWAAGAALAAALALARRTPPRRLARLSKRLEATAGQRLSRADPAARRRWRSLAAKVGLAARRGPAVKIGPLEGSAGIERSASLQRESALLADLPRALDLGAGCRERAIEIWELAIARERGASVLGIAFRIRPGLRAARWTIQVIHGGRSAPVYRWDGPELHAELQERIERRIEQRPASSSFDLDGAAPERAAGAELLLELGAEELDAHLAQLRRIRAGRFQFQSALPLLQKVAQNADVRWMLGAETLRRVIAGRSLGGLKVGQSLQVSVLCQDFYAWKALVEAQRSALLAFGAWRPGVDGVVRVPVAFREDLPQPLQLFQELDFALIGAPGAELVLVIQQLHGAGRGRFQLRGYVSWKPADVAFYRELQRRIQSRLHPQELAGELELHQV